MNRFAFFFSRKNTIPMQMIAISKCSCGRMDVAVLVGLEAMINYLFYLHFAADKIFSLSYLLLFRSEVAASHVDEYGCALCVYVAYLICYAMLDEMVYYYLYNDFVILVCSYRYLSNLILVTNFIFNSSCI